MALENKKDLTGQDRLVSNVLFSWGAYFVFFVAGFIMPRCMDHYIGQVNLGIWDFSWSLVNYMSLSGLGVGSSVNRYVAKFRAEGSIDKLNSAMSSVVCIQLCLAFVVVILTLTLVWLLPLLFSNRKGIDFEAARWVVLLLGSGLAVHMACDSARGIITGCHRWDVHNGINAMSRAIAVLGMLMVLVCGGGLRALAMVHLIVVILTEFVRMVISRKLCSGLCLSRKLVTLSYARQMAMFGFKTIIVGLPSLLVVQTCNVFIVSALGPAALAVFARSMALVRHVETFMNKFFFILTPTAGAMQGAKEDENLREFMFKMAQYGFAFAIPCSLTLVFWGEWILQLWMGDAYVQDYVLTILAIGYLFVISQGPILRILVGMNLHGKIGLLGLAVSTGCFCLMLLVGNYNSWNLGQFACLVAVPIALNGCAVAIYGCVLLKISFFEYLRRSFLRPFVCNVVFGVFLSISQVYLAVSLLSALLISVFGFLVLCSMYLYLLYSPAERDSFKSRFFAFRKS